MSFNQEFTHVTTLNENAQINENISFVRELTGKLQLPKYLITSLNKTASNYNIVWIINVIFSKIIGLIYFMTNLTSPILKCFHKSLKILRTDI